jgi:hypothetical protein
MTTLEEVLDRAMLEEAEPTHAALLRWTARYPEHRDALARFFAAWAVQEEMPEEAEARFDEERVHAAVLAHAQELLGRPAPRLLAAAELAGVSSEELAARCDLDDSLVARLDARMIDAATIPGELLRRLGQVLARGVEQVRAMLDEPAMVDRAAGFGGMQGAFGGAMQPGPSTPTPVKMDFVSAVRASGLPEDVKRMWREAT